MSGITTHVLDTARGRPAADIGVILEQVRTDGTSAILGRGRTDADGRLRTLTPENAPVAPGRYRLRFDTGAWFAALRVEGFYPEVVVEFAVQDSDRGCHIPLLLAPYGYSTYRGS